MQAMSEPLSEKVQGTVAHPAFPRAEEEMLLGYALHRMSHFGVTNRWAEDGVVWSFPMDANPTESRNGRFPTSQRIVAAVGCSFQVAEGLLQVAKDARIELIPVNYPSAALALRGVAGNADFSVVIGPESAEAILEGGNAWKPLLEAPIALTVLVDEKGEVPFPDDERWRVVKTGDISSLSVDEARAALGIDIVGQNQ